VNRTLDKRIRRLEAAYEEVLQRNANGCTLDCLEFYVDFAKLWPNPEDAPPMAHYSYKRLKHFFERWERKHQQPSEEEVR
jgi:hypothetical protein